MKKMNNNLFNRLNINFPKIIKEKSSIEVKEIDTFLDKNSFKIKNTDNGKLPEIYVNWIDPDEIEIKRFD